MVSLEFGLREGGEVEVGVGVCMYIHTPKADAYVDWDGLAADGDGPVGSGYDGGYPADGVVDAPYG